MSAATTVGIANGSSVVTRARPRAIGMRCITMAKARPSASSMGTLIAAKIEVRRTAAPKRGSVNASREVCQRHERHPEPRQPQVVLVHRLPGGRGDRRHRHAEDDDECRCHQKNREPAVGCRRDGAVHGRACSRPVRARRRPNLRGGCPKCRIRLLLCRERAMHVHLEELRQLRIDGRDWSGYGGLDRLPDFAKWHGERLRQCAALEERAPGGDLASRRRAFEHLLGRREEGDQRCGQVGFVGVAIDRELRTTERRCRAAARRRGEGGDADSICHARVFAARQGCPRVRPVPHERRLTRLKCESRVFLLRGEYRRRDEALSNAVAHERQRPDCFRTIDDDFAVVVEHAPSESGGVLEKRRDESLIARSLPEETVAHAAGTNGVERGRAQLWQRIRGTVE